MQHAENKHNPPPPPTHVNVENVVTRARYYFKRYPQNNIYTRQRIAYMLSFHFEQTPSQIARLMEIHPSTARRLVVAEEILLKSRKDEARTIDDLYDYILYNTRYIP